MMLTIGMATLIAWGGLPPSTARADAWAGRVTANVNLRAAPGLHGAVITGLAQGTIVQAHEETDGWVKVSYENDTFGYQGWVYGTYVQPTEALLPAPTAPAPAQLALPHPPEAVSAPLLPIASASRPVAARATTPTVAALPPAAPVEVAVKQQEARLPAPPASVLSLPIPNTARAQDTELERKVTTADHAPVAVFSRPAAASSAATGGRGVLAWLSLLLRLSTVALATLSLFMANRALQTAREANSRNGH